MNSQTKNVKHEYTSFVIENPEELDKEFNWYGMPWSGWEVIAITFEPKTRTHYCDVCEHADVTSQTETISLWRIWVRKEI